MAIELIDSPTAGAPLTDADYNSQNILIQSLLYHLMQNTKHLTEWTTLVEPELELYTYIQHGGALFQVKTENYSITDPGVIDGRVYIKIERSGDELIATFVNSAAGYTWNNIYNGFYNTDGDQLLPYVICLDNSEWFKYTLDGSENKFDITAKLHKKLFMIIESWNMNVSAGGSATYSVDARPYIPAFTNMVGVSVVIQNDLLSGNYQINNFNNAADPNLIWGGTSGLDNIFTLTIRTGSAFDSATFNDSNIDRGWLVIDYYI